MGRIKFVGGDESGGDGEGGRSGGGKSGKEGLVERKDWWRAIWDGERGLVKWWDRQGTDRGHKAAHGVTLESIIKVLPSNSNYTLNCGKFWVFIYAKRTQ